MHRRQNAFPGIHGKRMIGNGHGAISRTFQDNSLSDARSYWREQGMLHIDYEGWERQALGQRDAGFGGEAWTETGRAFPNTCGNGPIGSCRTELPSWFLGG